MRRREFISLIGGTAAAWPLAARAQQSAMRVIGILSPETPASPFVEALRVGLQELGYVDGPFATNIDGPKEILNGCPIWLSSLFV